MSLPVVASRQNGSTSFRSEPNRFSSDLDVRPKGSNNESAKKELSKVDSDNSPKVKPSCRRTFSSPISRENSSTALKPHRKFGETRIRWKEEENVVHNLAAKYESKKPAAVGLHNVAAAKILGRNWQQKNQQHRLVSNLKNAEPPLVEVLSPVEVKKKYKKKKHSLSSPSLGKYSPLLLRKVFQQQKDPQQQQQQQLSKVEVRIDEEDETSFGQLWASEMSRIRGEEKRIGGFLEEREKDNGEAAFPFASGLYASGGENKNNFSSSSSSLLFGGTFSNSNSCSLAVLQQEQRLAVPVIQKKKKKSIISSLSLGPKELPKKLVAVQQNLVSVNSQIWNRRQAVKKSRKSIASFSCIGNLIAEPIIENDPTDGSVIHHCLDRDCCCHLRKSQNVGCSVCAEETKQPRKKSSILSRLPISAKRQQSLKDHRKMLLGGKTTVRMNSEPLLGRRTTQQKHSLSMGESSTGPPKTRLVPRRDFGPAAGHSRHPMLRFSRGSWISKPTEENPTEKVSSPKKLSLTAKSTRRHSAPPVSRQQSVTFFKTSLLKTMTVKDFVEKGTINLPLWKIVQDKKVSIVFQSSF
jgi:hypothetical protein